MDALKRRVIQEDVVQYKLFLVKPNASSSQQIEERLTHLVEEILAKVAPLLIQYIWQHQPFNLKYYTEKGIMLLKPKRPLCIIIKKKMTVLVLHLLFFVHRWYPCSYWRKHSVWRQCGRRVVYCLPLAANHRCFSRACCQVRQSQLKFFVFD